MSTDDALRAAVRDRYAATARSQTEGVRQSCCGPATAASTCCGGSGAAGGSDAGGGSGSAVDLLDPITRDLYGDEAAEASLSALEASLGCGNPTALAALRPGEAVLDLGSGGGLDVLLSARRVSPGGKAYGLDMTPEMLELARRNQREAGVTNAEFLEGTIEKVPLPDAAVDVVISNCVINLSPDKDAVLAEAYRVLRPGGRFAVSDIVLTRPLPPVAMAVIGLWTGCVSGALVDADYVAKLTQAGFAEASLEITRRYDRADLEQLAADLPAHELPDGLSAADLVQMVEGAVAGAFVRAVKPA